MAWADPSDSATSAIQPAESPAYDTVVPTHTRRKTGTDNGVDPARPFRMGGQYGLEAAGHCAKSAPRSAQTHLSR